MTEQEALRKTDRPAQSAPFLVTDQAGNELPASITVHASTPLVAVEYVGDLDSREIAVECDLVEVARRFRRDRPKAVTTIRPVRSRQVVATIVVDVPDIAEDDGAAGGDRREESERDRRRDSGHIAGVGEAEAACRRGRC